MPPSTPRSDPADRDSLLERAAGGDPGAVNDLLARDREALRLFVDRCMDAAIRRRTDPSDIVNEAQLEIAQRLREYWTDPPMPFQAWIRKTARERWINVYHGHRAQCRDVRRDQALPDDSSVALAERFVARGVSPSENLVAQEQLAQVAAAVAGLKDSYREVLLMRHMEGLAHETIASILEITPDAARQRYVQALNRLAKELRKAGVSLEVR
jgi:RNA polymerase sigma-70 factor, ECF subfamily